MSAQRPYKAYIEGYHEAISGITFDVLNASWWWRRAYRQGQADGARDRQRIIEGKFFMAGCP